MLRRFLLLVLALPSLATERADAQAVVTASRPTDVSVTVYRDPGRGQGGEVDLDYLKGFALITETRTVNLPVGESVVRFEGVSEGMIAVSAVVTGLPGGVAQKNRDAALLSPAALLDRSLGNRVTVRRTSRATGRVVEQEAIIRTGSGGAVVLQTAEGVEALRCSGLPETLIYGNVPADLSAEPVMSVTTVSPNAVSVTVTLTYLSTGFDWAANYVATVNPDGRTLDLFAWLTLANSNAETFADAQLLAVAGTLEKQQDYDELVEDAPSPVLRLSCYPLDTTSTAPRWGIEPPPVTAPSPPSARMAMPSAEAEYDDNAEIVVTGSRIPRQEELGDLKLYRVPFRSTVAANAQKQVALLTKDDVPFRQLYIYESWMSDDFDDEPAEIELRLENKEGDGLGLPMPSGGVAIFRRANDSLLLVAEDRVGDHAIGQTVKISAGKTDQVRVTWNNYVDEKDEDGDLRTAIVTNANPFPVDVELRLADDDSYRFQGKDAGKFKRQDGKWVWVVRVPANSSRKIKVYLREVDQ